MKSTSNFRVGPHTLRQERPGSRASHKPAKLVVCHRLQKAAPVNCVSRLGLLLRPASPVALQVASRRPSRLPRSLHRNHTGRVCMCVCARARACVALSVGSGRDSVDAPVFTHLLFSTQPRTNGDAGNAGVCFTSCLTFILSRRRDRISEANPRRRVYISRISQAGARGG